MITDGSPLGGRVRAGFEGSRTPSAGNRYHSATARAHGPAFFFAMSTVIENIEKAQVRKGLPSFSPGDRVRVHFQVVEGNRRRTQVFEGVVLRRQGSGVRETFTVRKQSFGVGVERTFPLHSPKIEQLEVAARGDVRRAKLYYLRDRIGKAARVTERRWGSGEELGAVSIVADEDTATDQSVETDATTAPVEDAAVAEAAESDSGSDGDAAAEAEPQAEATATEEATPDEVTGDAEAAGDSDESGESKA